MALTTRSRAKAPEGRSLEHSSLSCLCRSRSIIVLRTESIGHRPRERSLHSSFYSATGQLFARNIRWRNSNHKYLSFSGAIIFCRPAWPPVRSLALAPTPASSFTSPSATGQFSNAPLSGVHSPVELTVKEQIRRRLPRLIARTVV